MEATAARAAAATTGTATATATAAATAATAAAAYLFRVKRMPRSQAPPACASNRHFACQILAV